MRRPMNPALIPGPASRGLPCALAVLSLAFAGCLMQQSSFSAKITTADGELLDVPLTIAKQDVHDDAMSVKNFQFAPWKMEDGKGVAFAFQLQMRNGAKPVAVSVDDVTDAPILSIITDNAPVLTKDNVWNNVSPPHHPVDEYAKWMLTLENSVRVYRFTVKLADGTTHVLWYPIFVPTNMKSFMRGQLGAG